MTTNFDPIADKAIPWFNPREMDDATLVALATGRETLLHEFLLTVERRRQGIAQGHTGEHWLVTGTRGAGKSYFLRYAQICTGKRYSPDEVRFVLLPEELRNLRAPHNLLDEISRMLSLDQGDKGRVAQWRSEDTEALWHTALQRLIANMNSQPTQLLVVGIENFAQVLERAFNNDVAASLLRQLMEHEPRILFIASALDGSFDEKYRQRLYLQFSKHPLPVWDAAAHRAYLTERAKLVGQTPTSRQLARIDAYSRYTGGNARIAAILAAAILDEADMTRTSADLNATLDKMSDYYRALLDAMPTNTGSLFDALVRDGEPCSQTQLAERVGARQNDISRAFLWLLDGGYLLAKRPTGQKEILYQVADRLFVQWYRMRYITPGQLSRLAVLAELLADTLEFDEKWSYSKRFALEGAKDDALLMLGLTFKDFRIDIRKLMADGAGMNDLLDWGERLHQLPVKGKNKNESENLQGLVFIDLLENFSDEDVIQKEFSTALTLANSCEGFPGTIDGNALAALCLGSLSLGPVEKLRAIRQLPRLTHSQWQGLAEVFQYEIKEFEDLMPAEGGIIADLKKISEAGVQYPWLMSWYGFQILDSIFSGEESYSISDKNFIRVVSNGVFCLYAAPNPPGDLAIYAERAWGKLHTSLLNLEVEYALGERILEFVRPLLKAGVNSFPRKELGKLYAVGANVASWQGQHVESFELAKQAVACFEPAHENMLNLSGYEFALERLGWACGQQGNWQQALACHQKILALWPENLNSWNIGQIGRHLWHVEGFESAWAFISAQSWEQESSVVHAIQQLGDRVVDEQSQYGTTEAYALARQLLARVLQQTLCKPAKAVRALFIDMVSEDLSLAILGDLANDLANDGGQLVGQADNPASENEEVALLGQTLAAWIADLHARQTTATIPTTGPTDPDWQMTLEALNKALPIHVRIRLGLEPQPQLGPNASRLFQAMLRFVHRRIGPSAIPAGAV